MWHLVFEGNHENHIKHLLCISSEQQHRGVKRTQDGEEQSAQRVIQPMKWGLIPPFHKVSWLMETSGFLAYKYCFLDSV